MKSKLTTNDLLEYIRKLQQETELRESDLTVVKVMKEIHCGRGTAERYLREIAKKGLAKEITIRGKGGNMTRAWRKV